MLQLRLSCEFNRFADPELRAGLTLLAGSCMIQRLDFGGFILLRPEVLSRYAAAVVRKVRKHPRELGCIREHELLAGDWITRISNVCCARTRRGCCARC